MESQASAQEQLDRLASDREALRARARYPFWYFALWALACSWWGLIAIVPESQRLWLGLVQWLLFLPLFVWHSRRKVKVPRPPWTWPTRREWLLGVPALLVCNVCWYVGFKYDQAWLVTATAAVLAVLLAVLSYRDQRVVFTDER